MEFQNGKIYTIRSYQTEKYYIGSTNQKTLAQRLGKHRSNYIGYLKNDTKGYMTSFEILQYDDHYIELLELYPCNSKEELHQREGQLQRQFKNEMINNNIANRTKIEWRKDNNEKIKDYRESHKEEHKAYSELHKEQIATQQKAYNDCHKDEKRAYDKAYRELNKEKIKDYDKARRQAKKLLN